MACVQRARGNVGRHTVAVAVLRPGTLAGTAAFLHAPPRQFEASASTVAGAAHECIVIQIMPRHGSVAAALVRVRSAPCSPRAWPSTIAGHCVHGCALAGLIVSGRQRRRVRNETGAAGTIRRVPSHAKNLVCSVTNVPGTVRNLETGAMSSIAAAKLCGRTRGQVHRGQEDSRREQRGGHREDLHGRSRASDGVEEIYGDCSEKQGRRLESARSPSLVQKNLKRGIFTTIRPFR